MPARADRTLGMMKNVGKRACDLRPALPHQPTSPGASNPATMAIHVGLGFGVLGPGTATAVGFGAVRPAATGREIRHRLVTVVPLVGDDRVARLRLVDRDRRGFNLLRGRKDRLDDRGGIAVFHPTCALQPRAIMC